MLYLIPRRISANRLDGFVGQRARTLEPEDDGFEPSCKAPGIRL